MSPETMEPRIITCPGCGLSLPAATWPEPDGFHASAECWERYGELAGYTLTLRDPSFPHQYAVDAYAAQHAGAASKPITTFFALVGLYLACEHGLSGRAVQRAHMALAQTGRDWPVLMAPSGPWPVTVANVLDSAPGRQRDEALRAWASSVWSVWRSEHARIRELTSARLPGDIERFGS
jgi:hypothetical protein